MLHLGDIWPDLQSQIKVMAISEERSSIICDDKRNIITIPLQMEMLNTVLTTLKHFFCLLEENPMFQVKSEHCKLHTTHHPMKNWRLRISDSISDD